MRAIYNNAIEGALLDLISPDEGHGPGSVVISNDLNSILMRFGDLIVKELRLVILDLNSHSADLNLILDDVSINIQRCDDRRALAESDLVSLDLWLG